MQTARRTVRTDDLPALYALVEEKPFYSFQGLGNSFPTDPACFVDRHLVFLSPLGLQKEVFVQVWRLNHYKRRIVEALGSLDKVNSALALQDWDKAASHITRHKSEFGLSLAILKKELFCVLQTDGLAGLATKRKELAEDFPNTAFALLLRYLYDMLDPAYNPRRSSGYWYDACGKRTDADWVTALIQFDLLTCCADKERLASALLRFNAVSLLDLALCFWRARGTRNDWSELSKGWAALDLTVREFLEDRFATMTMTVPKSSSANAARVTDAEVLRLSAIFDEYANVASWRVDIQLLLFHESLEERAFDFDFLSNRPVITSIRAMLPTASDVSRVPDLTFLETIPFLDSANLSDNTFLFSLAAAEMLRDGASRISANGQVLILSRAVAIQNYLSLQTLANLAKSEQARSSPILRFLLAELSYRKSRSGEDELERRALFMELIPNRQKTNIRPYIEGISGQFPRLAVDLARLCTRRFLERLFLIMSSVQDVLETRLSICEWLLNEDAANANDYREERSALQRELSDLDARSDLDSTRIHVDEEALRDWFRDVHDASVARYVQTGPAERYAAI